MSDIAHPQAVFQGQRHAMQRWQRAAFAHRAVRLHGFLQRLLGAHADHRVDLTVPVGNLPQVRFDDLQRRHLAAPDQGRQFRR